MHLFKQLHALTETSKQLSISAWKLESEIISELGGSHTEETKQ